MTYQSAAVRGPGQPGRGQPGRGQPGRAVSLRVGVLATLFLAGLFTAFLVPANPDPAAAEAYRFWGFYQWKDGAWTFASKGPAAITPADGAVDGWRLAVSGESTPPRVP